MKRIENESLLMKNQEFEHHESLDYLRDWIKEDLPKINQKVLSQEISYTEFFNIIKTKVSEFPLDQNFTKGEARSALLYLGFLMSSLERHSQDLGNKAGMAVEELGSDFGSLLSELSKIAHHPPRDSVYSWCVWNQLDENGEALSFTGDVQELLFIDIVNQSFFAGDEAAELIREVTFSEEPIGSEQNLARLRKAAEMLEVERQEYLRYLAKDENGNPGMSADFFLNVLRQYLITYPVNGEEWGAPTAANSPHHWVLDLLLKPIDVNYIEHIKGRLRYLTDEDLERVEQVLDNPGLIEKLANEVGLSAEQFMEMSDEDYFELIDSLPEYTRLAFERVAEFIKQYADTTAMHWGLIVNYITRPSKMMVDVATTVSPDLGTSGLEIADVAVIRDMRRNLGNAQRHKKRRK